MSSPPHGRPASVEEGGSGTWEVKARVLGVARNLTSATRLRDVLSLLRSPDGIEIWYTVNPGSDFSAGLAEYLVSVSDERHVLSWDDARRGHFDLAVACAVNSSMHALNAPLVVLPHGAGYNRLVLRSTGDTRSPAGLSRRELTHKGAVVPDLIGLSHEEQRSRLARSCPEALPYAAVVGDVAYDRAVVSLRQRDRYRQGLGAVDGRRLVVVSTTWSPHSLLGRCPELPLRLMAQLPADEFRVALVTHPNVWAWHGDQAVFDRLAEARDAGLAVLPPQEGWRAALIAGDWIVGDHGSTTFYGAALGLTTLLAADGLEELDPRSPTAAFTRDAPRLDPEGDLYAQLLSAAETYDPGPSLAAFDEQVGVRGESARILRDRLYGYLAHRGVRCPQEPPWLTPVPEPVPAPAPSTGPGARTFDVVGGVTEDGAVAVRRFPVVPGHHREGRGFYAVTWEETHPLLPQSAEVMVRTVVDSETPAHVWLDQCAHRFPGLNVCVAALDENCHLVRLRDGLLLEAHVPRAFKMSRQRLDPVLLGAAVNLRLTSPQAGPLGEELTIRTGTRDLRVRFTGEG